MASTRQLRSDRHAHDEALTDGVRPACAALALLFLVFTAWHAVDFEPAVARTMVPLALATALLAAGIYVALRRRRLPAGRAHLLAAVLATAAYVNCVVQLALTGAAENLTLNVLLLLIGIGVCLLDPLWVGGLLAGLAATWVTAVWLWGPPDVLSRTVSNLIIGVIVATMANLLRRRTLSRLLIAHEALRELSVRCELTGLLNRRGFLDAAGRRMDAGEPVTLWFIDVDGLKAVNDQRGHDIGDLLLLSVAEALREVFADAVVARLSGDEFAVVEADGTVEHLAARLHRLHERLAAAERATNLPTHVSTGTATARPGQDLGEVLSAADAAMYVTKAAKRATRAGGARTRTTAHAG